MTSYTKKSSDLTISVSARPKNGSVMHLNMNGTLTFLQHVKYVSCFLHPLSPTSVEHKLLVIGPTEPWSVREKLCLATSVMKSGDQNWYCAVVQFVASDHLFSKELM